MNNLNPKNNLSETGFFIMQDGNIVSVETHIDYVFDNPDDFGFTLSELTSIYNKHKEKIRFEGKARVEILLNVIKNGVIRIRKYIRPEYWSLNVYELTKETKNKINTFFKKLIEHGNKNIAKYDDVKIWEMKNDKIYKFTVEDLTQGTVL